MKTRIARKKSHATSLSLCLLVAVGWLAAPPAAHSERHRLTFRQTYLGTGHDPYGTSATAVADFNGDGHADLAVPVELLNQVLVYNGDGHGRFGPPATYPGGSFPVAIITGDFNGDGQPDIVLGDNYSGSVGVQILLNDGKGGFNAPVFISLDAGYVLQMVVGDFNRDGKLDLVLSLPLVPGGHTLFGTAVLLGDGRGGFGAPIAATGYYYGLMAVEDLNEDGIPDLAVAATGQLDIFLGNGFGGFTLVNSYLYPGLVGGVATADFNHDGHVDVAVAEGSPSVVDVFPGNGEGSFNAPTIVPSSTIDGLLAVDLDGDGNVDLAAADYFINAVSVARGNGRGGFGVLKDFPLTVPMAPGPRNLTAGDFNGDGLPDLVTSDYLTGGATVLVNLYR